MNSDSRWTRIAAQTLFAVLLFGCSRPDSPSHVVEAPPGSLLIRGAGATFPFLLYQKWFAEYEGAHPNITISYDAVGSGDGVRRFIGNGVKKADTINFAASDAAMTDEQIAQTPRGVLMVPVTAGVVAVAYNLPKFEGELKLSRDALAGIFLGRIRKWNNPAIVRTNPGVSLPNLDIVTVARLDASGTTFAFTKHLDAISPEWSGRYGAGTLIDWPGNTMRARGNENVAGRIQHSDGSIGYVGFEFAHRLGLKMARLQNRDGNFVGPGDLGGTVALSAMDLPRNLRMFIADPAGRDAYPIVTLSWILLYRNYDDPREATAVRDLFRWCLNEGQNFAPGLGYVPLPRNIRSKALAALGDHGPPD